MDLDPTLRGGLEMGLTICPAKTSTAAPAHIAAYHRTPCSLMETRAARRDQIRAFRGEGAGRSGPTPEASVPSGSVSGKLQHYLKIVAHP